MAEKKTVSKTTKPKAPASKKVSIAFDKEFYSDLEEYVTSKGISVESFIKTAVKEKLDSDRISSMIDVMSFKR